MFVRLREQRVFSPPVGFGKRIRRRRCRPIIAHDDVSTLLREEEAFFNEKKERGPLSHAHTRTHTHTPKVVERVLRLHSVSFLLLFEEGKNFLLFSFLSHV